MGTGVAPPVVTVSATYGSGGSVIARGVAEALGLPFFDRAITGAAAAELGLSPQEAQARDEVGPTGLERFVRSLAAVGPVSGVDLRADFLDRSFCDATEHAIRGHADADGGVFLGRAAAVVLRGRPATLHVRLDGPPARRVEQAMRIEGIERSAAERRLRDNDAARAAYVREFYGADAADPALYHLMLDSTALDPDASIAVIACAAERVTGARRAGRD
jgi:cytidylate kinase